MSFMDLIPETPRQAQSLTEDQAARIREASRQDVLSVAAHASNPHRRGRESARNFDRRIERSVDPLADTIESFDAETDRHRHALLQAAEKRLAAQGAEDIDAQLAVVRARLDAARADLPDTRRHARELARHFLAEDTLRNEIADLERHDVTGLMNRKTFRTKSVERLRIAAERNSSCALGELDLNSLKLVNDQVSAANGDRFLRLTAQILRATMPGNALVCHYGGDEFVVLLPDTAASDMAALLADARTKLEKTTLGAFIGTNFPDIKDDILDSNGSLVIEALESQKIRLEPWRVFAGVLETPLTFAYAAKEIPAEELKDLELTSEYMDILDGALKTTNSRIKKEKAAYYDLNPAIDARRSA